MSNFYLTLTEAKAAAQKLGIRGHREYQRRYKEDSLLPSCPNEFYRDFVNWYEFFGKNKPEFYPTLEDASAAALKLGIKGVEEYKQRYKEDPRLVANPAHFYKGFENWYAFLGKQKPEFYPTLEKASAAVRKLGIKNAVYYQKRYKLDPRLPSNPSVIYSNFENWFYFLAQELPYTPENISPEYSAWRERVNEFLKNVRGAMGKKCRLCRFVRNFIEVNQLATSPESFLLQSQNNTQAYRNFLDQQLKNQRKRIKNAVHEFIEWVLGTYLTEEDEETGERVRTGNARNPFRTMQIEPVTTPKLGQTVRNLLPFHYLRKARDWIIPSSARHFRDLKHLYEPFDRDWVIVDVSRINRFDPNCVWKEDTNKKGAIQYSLWCPVSWIHLYALMMTGLRSSMIAHCDSGEADSEIPDLDKDGKILWEKNSGSMAGLTKHQSVIAQCPDHQVGLYTPRSKCHDTGFFCLWMDEQLAYWLIQLRRWQSTYNPIITPTPWTQLTRLREYNEQQKRQKGVNCFLFRDFSDVQPAEYPARLNSSLAATLYQIQDEEIELAKVPVGKERRLSYYQSSYSPHSIRGSYITALIMEGGLSPFIVMRLVAHQSLMMTSYYCKPDNEAIRFKIREAEKKALQDQIVAKQAMIRQGKINQLKQELVSNDSTGELLSSLVRPDSQVHSGSYMFSDIGICPFARSRCHDGGQKVEGSKKQYEPVFTGYLGSQNCLRCRHHVTGPAWLGGLLSLSNEMLLAVRKQSEHHQRLLDDRSRLKVRLERLDDEQYDANQAGKTLDKSSVTEVTVKLEKTEAEIEQVAMKMDVFLCDLQASSKLLRQCHAIINQQVTDGNSDSPQQLIVQSGFELKLDCEESSELQQLSEVCENAEIYQSANADLAIAPRSQLLDRLLKINNIIPILFELDEQQQLNIGNEFVRLLQARLKTWDRIDDLAQGKIFLKDLTDDEKITHRELREITHPDYPKVVDDHE